MNKSKLRSWDHQAWRLPEDGLLTVCLRRYGCSRRCPNPVTHAAAFGRKYGIAIAPMRPLEAQSWTFPAGPEEP